MPTSAPTHPRRRRCSASQYLRYSFGLAPGRSGRLGADLGTDLRGAVLSALVFGCGAAPARPATPVLPAPAGEEARAAAVNAWGRVLFAALQAGRPRAVLLDDLRLREALAPEAASRFAASRVAIGARLRATPSEYAQFASAQYAGVCLQGVRAEPRAGPLGLVADGWVAERALVMGVQPSGAVTRRLGAWVEGVFLYTSDGFRAIDLARAERPRWEHSDLDLAPCDVEVGIRSPLPVVLVTP